MAPDGLVAVGRFRLEDWLSLLGKEAILKGGVILEGRMILTKHALVEARVALVEFSITKNGVLAGRRNATHKVLLVAVEISRLENRLTALTSRGFWEVWLRQVEVGIHGEVVILN